MRLLICIDDTDTLDSKGTGSIAKELCGLIEEQGFGLCGEITRHQLLLHEDVPYTSHNSSMCFDCTVTDGCQDILLPRLYAHLKKESAPESNPGLAVANINDSKLDQQALLNYGLDAKCILLTKEQSYALARENGIYLAEAGSTGQGVVGALAGIGLRLGGNDGEIRGEINGFIKGNVYSISQLKHSGRIQMVCGLNGQSLPDTEYVRIVWKAKPLLLNHQVTLLVNPSGEAGLWITLEKKEMREYGDLRALSNDCGHFTPDVDEEQVCAPVHSCVNCRYRRWLSNGFHCAADF